MQDLRWIKSLNFFALGFCLNFQKIQLLIYAILEQWMEHIVKYITGLFFLAITTLDADKEILILALVLVAQEDRVNWLWFLGKIAPYLTSLQDQEAVIISNRLKSLFSAVSECFPSTTYSYYSKHSYDNLRVSYEEVEAQKF